MRSSLLILSAATLLLSHLSSAQVIKPAPERPLEERLKNGSIWEYQTEKYWWGYTLTQARDKVLAEPGWHLALDEADPNEVLLKASADNGQAILLFAFHQEEKSKEGLLYRRSYAYPTGSPLAVEWDTQLKELPYDNRNSMWTESYTRAHIKRSYVSGWIMYTVEIFYEDEAKK